MSIIQQRYNKVGTFYLSIIMCTNVRRTCARTIAVQRKWSAISTVYWLPYCVLSLLWVPCVVLTTTDVCTVWCGWQFDDRRYKFVMVKTQHDVQICAVKSEKVGCTKMCYFENCVRSGKQERARGPKDRECSKEHWGTLLVSQTYSVVLSLWVWYDGRWASYKNECSISWDEMSMIWIDVSFDSSCAVSHWLLEHGCNVLCTRATVIRD